MPGVLSTLIVLHGKIPVAVLAHPEHPPLMVNLITGEANEIRFYPLESPPGTSQVDELLRRHRLRGREDLQ